MNHHEDGVNTNVYIRGLSAEMDDDKLYEMTACYGNVISHKAIMDTENGGCKGYGFARFETVEEAVLCIEKLTEMNIEADFARESFNSRLKRLADPASTNVYVSNLPFDMNEKGMEEIFHGYKVISNRILRDANGKSRGVGFARFTDRATCDEIINKFHGMPIGNAGNVLQIRYADTAAQKKFKATTARRKVSEFAGSRFSPSQHVQNLEHISDGSSVTCVDESRKTHKTMEKTPIDIDNSLEECGLQISSLEIGEDLLN
ncbi:hypothetical protein BJ508DRAFT_417479 [Ascobolus immersus RN42]|uniref:RRM domain-containing protein n=1 Tax=Ascobolus immersus RN42 TaxID=1160509 RepID=A0A3N4I4C0_ASCIM|nr:hypothetical protein BJ508DRAFT_417479 [Ascobolus immersus RN42]